MKTLSCGEITEKMHKETKMSSKIPDIAKAITYSQIEKKTKELLWCHICKMNFDFVKELTHHFQSSHTNEKRT
jgi:hypothetical protein